MTTAGSEDYEGRARDDPTRSNASSTNLTPHSHDEGQKKQGLVPRELCHE